MSLPAVSIVCPFFNEEPIIEAAVRQMLTNLDQQFGDRFELLLVNDGSRDSSVERLVRALDQEPRRSQVRVLSCPTNQGRGRALKNGIDAARAPIIVTTEADCSWGNDIVQRLYCELATRPEIDFVVASPHMEGGRLVNVSANRVFLTRAGNWLIRRFFESRVTMNTGMTRAYRAHVIQPLLTEENGKEFHLEVLLKLLALGFKWSEIPATLTWLEHKLQRAGSTKRKSSTNIYRTITSHLRFIAIAQPVRHYAYLTLVSLLISALFFCSAVTMLVLKTAPAIYLTLVSLGMLIIALLFGGFAILFHQFREMMRLSWMQPYGGNNPPSARPANQVYPPLAQGS